MASTGTIFVVFAVAIVLFHTIFVWLRPLRLTELGWKRVDYAWLSMAMVSVVGLSGEARQYFATTMLPHSEAGLNYIASDVLKLLPEWQKIPCNPPYVKSQDSPSNFDDIMKQLEDYCAWLRTKEDELTAIVEARQLVDETSFFTPSTQFPLVGGVSFHESHLQSQVLEYNRRLAEHQALESEAEKSDLEIIIIYFAPLALVIALALRLTKVSGEIWWHRRRKIGN